MRLSLAFICALLSSLWARPARAMGEETQGLVFGVELGGHFGAGPGALSRTAPEVSFAELGPPVDEVALTFGSRVDALRSELALRVAYGFASGSADAGGTDVDYSVRRIPITFAWRAAFLDGPVHPLLGVDAGLLWTSARYRGAFEGEAGFDLGFTLRALGGVDFDVGESSHLRAFLQYRLDPGRTVVGGPDLGGEHLAFGLGYLVSFDRPEPRVRPPATGPLRSAGTGSGLEDAFEWIRRGDALAREGDAAAAVRAYQRGVELLPRDPQTRKNVEVPVRVDWAEQLARAGRREEAIEVLQSARRITPADASVLDALRRLGASLEAPVEDIEDGPAPVIPH